MELVKIILIDGPILESVEINRLKISRVEIGFNGLKGTLAKWNDEIAIKWLNNGEMIKEDINSAWFFSLFSSLDRKSEMCRIINVEMDFDTEKILPLWKSDANFQGIRSRIILAVTQHRAHFTQCTCPPLARALRCRVSRSSCNPPRNRARLPRAAPWSWYTRTWSDWNSTRLSRSSFRGRISLRQSRREPNLPKQRYSTWLHANAGVKFDSAY